MNQYVGIADVKRYLKDGGRREEIATFMGYSTPSSINKWIARRRVPRWQQKKLKEFFLTLELKKIKQ